MEACVRLAKQYNVRVGAHPGLRSNFGRGKILIQPRELELLLLQQTSALECIARAHELKLHHIKLHGSLYHATEATERLARAYLLAVRRWYSKSIVYARAGGRVAALAPRVGVRVWEEAFADRAYESDGSLVARSWPAAIISDIREITKRVKQLIEEKTVLSRSGTLLRMAARTLCVHSDTPRAVEIAVVCREVID